MYSTRSIAMALVCVFGLGACAAETKTPPPPTVSAATASTEKGGVRAQEVTVTATVEKIDVKNREVTLKGPDGASETITVGPEVRNLPQVKRGDHVVVTYYQSVAFEVLKPGQAKPSVDGSEGAARTELGERPGAAGARVITLVADIVKLDRRNQQAVLRGPKGKVVTVNVQNPDAFNKVKVGDTVEIKLTEALAIDVQPAPK